MSKHFVSVFMLLLSLNACAASSPKRFTPEEEAYLRQVTVLKQEPASISDCRYLGPLEASDGEAEMGRYRLGSFEQAMRLLQLKASHRDANLIILDSERPSQDDEVHFAYILRGRTFACPGRY